MKIKYNILTIFPHLIEQYCSESILQRAQDNGIIEVNPVDIREYAENKHNKVDDKPYGGGAGMVMKPEPIYRALKDINALANDDSQRKTVLLSPKGKQFDQQKAKELSKLKEVTMIAGRYEGVDQRVADHMVDEEISIGEYILAGGELASLVILEASARLVPGVLGNPESLQEESYTGISEDEEKISAEYPQYTRPREFKGWEVPEVLLSGNHKKIEEWRQKQSD